MECLPCVEPILWQPEPLFFDAFLEIITRIFRITRIASASLSTKRPDRESERPPMDGSDQ